MDARTAYSAISWRLLDDLERSTIYCNLLYQPGPTAAFEPT